MQSKLHTAPPTTIKTVGQLVCCLRGKIWTNKKTANHSLMLAKLEHAVVTEGDSDESINMLINSEPLPSGFWHLDVSC